MTVGVISQKLPSYGQPPVTEVACSVLFPSIDGLLSPHIGLLWQRFQPEYPFCDDVVPITPRVEIFSDHNVEPQLMLSNVPPLPRVWFISQDGTRIIQVQRDRFVHNWRKVEADSEYPRYSSLIKSFQDYLVQFNDFLIEAELGIVEPIQYELTYVNKIPQGEAWITLEDIGKVFPDISWKASSSRFLTYPQGISWSTIFELPEAVGRLHTSVKAVIFNGKADIFFELTVRGIKNHESPEILKNWFDTAHDWIVCAFSDLTGEDTQTKIWKRRE